MGVGDNSMWYDLYLNARCQLGVRQKYDLLHQTSRGLHSFICVLDGDSRMPSLGQCKFKCFFSTYAVSSISRKPHCGHNES